MQATGEAQDPIERRSCNVFKMPATLSVVQGRFSTIILMGHFTTTLPSDHFLPMAAQNMPPKKLNQALSYGSRNTDWGTWPAEERDTIDFKTADYCVEVLKNPPKISRFFSPVEFSNHTHHFLHPHAIKRGSPTCQCPFYGKMIGQTYQRVRENWMGGKEMVLGGYGKTKYSNSRQL